MFVSLGKYHYICKKFPIRQFCPIYCLFLEKCSLKAVISGSVGGLRNVLNCVFRFYIFTHIYIMTDKERIEEIIKAKKLTNVEFCNQTAMSPSGLSHILSERTKPTLSILRNIVEAFPDLNPMWVFMEQGKMFKDESQVVQSGSQSPQEDVDDIFASLKNGLTPSSVVKSQQSIVQPPADSTPQVNVEEVVGLTLARLQKPQRKVTEVRIFFDDGTYETFSAH